MLFLSASVSMDNFILNLYSQDKRKPCIKFIESKQSFHLQRWVFSWLVGEKEGEEAMKKKVDIFFHSTSLSDHAFRLRYVVQIHKNLNYLPHSLTLSLSISNFLFHKFPFFTEENPFLTSTSLQQNNNNNNRKCFEVVFA